MEKTLHENDYLRFEIRPQYNTVLVTAKKHFIPGDQFRQGFETFLTRLKPEQNIEKMVFDKRNLTVFDQDAMVWYHLDWKPRAYKKGIRKHVKLLPEDKVFRTSVQVGRNKIQREHPEFDFERYNITYKESIEEALDKPRPKV